MLLMLLDCCPPSVQFPQQLSTPCPAGCPPLAAYSSCLCCWAVAYAAGLLPSISSVALQQLPCGLPAQNQIQNDTRRYFDAGIVSSQWPSLYNLSMVGF